MLETLFNGTIGETLTVWGTIIIVLSSMVLGVIISLVYMFTHKKEDYSSGFIITLVMLPTIISLIILLVGSSVARAFSLAGAFALIRFRSAPGGPKDIAYVFFTLAVGLACGIGYIAYAVLFTIILSIAVLILEKINFGVKKEKSMKLKIVIPEDLDYNGVFDEVLNKYTLGYQLNKIKTSDFGSLYELTYLVKLKDFSNSKEFIDNLRCKNGNLNITLTLKENKESNF